MSDIGDIFAKAFTLGYETGRNYIPAGGMALTAEQVEDVRLLLDELASERDECDTWDLYERLCALFPATEPAEHVHEQGAHYTKGHTKAGTWTVSTCRTCGAVIERATEDGAWIDRTDPLVPAEPAEEETKAESHMDKHGVIVTGSPVAPAPTETGPHIGGAWLTDRETKDAEMILRMVSINRHFSEWARNRCREISTTLAPFVAAEEKL